MDSALVPTLATVKPYIETHPIGKVWIAVALAAAVIEVAGAFRRRAEATQRDAGSRMVLRVCVAPAVLILVLSPRIAPGATIRPPLVAAIVGICLFAAGEALRVWAKAALGHYFTYTVQTSADQPVITSGPYRLVRHPSYSGILLMAIGASLTYGNWLGVAALVLGALLGLLYRIRVEERALLDDLGERYREYAAHHKRLIPFIW